MTYAELLARLKSTSYYLATAQGDLRERLPGAYAVGFGTIDVAEVRALHPALAQRFEALIARISAEGAGPGDWIDASVAQMGDGERVAVATELLDIEDMAMTAPPPGLAA